MSIIMIICAIGCFVISFYCGYWALHKVRCAPESAPHYEFVIKQLTMGAWTFGLLFVASMVMAGFYWEPPSSTPSGIINDE